MYNPPVLSPYEIVVFLQETKLSLCSSPSADNVTSVRAPSQTSVWQHGELHKHPLPASVIHFLMDLLLLSIDRNILFNTSKSLWQCDAV